MGQNVEFGDSLSLTSESLRDAAYIKLVFLSVPSIHGNFLVPSSKPLNIKRLQIVFLRVLQALEET